MIKNTVLNDAASALKDLLAAALAVPVDRTSSTAGQLSQAIGSLSANTAAAIAGLTFGADLVTVFALMRQAGASFAAVDALRVQALSGPVVNGLSGIVIDGFIWQALACQCRIAADLDFVSRDQVDQILSVLDAAFETSIDKASDEFDQVTVRALVGLRAAVIRDMTARARPLPKMVGFSFARRRPVLWLSQRLYGDGGRYQELIAENGVVHPLFAPAAGRALGS